MPTVDKKKSKKLPEITRQVIYPEVQVNVAAGANALTVQQMKDLLGWQEETEEVKFGGDYLLTDAGGKKVRCLNNAHNRPLTESWARTIAQDILNKHWKFNGETIIIGRTGLVLSGQHRLIGGVLAEQDRTGPQEHHWKSRWDGPITMDCLVVFGIEESGEITRTLDNVKPRTLADVLFCDEAVFGKVKPADRQKLCRMADYAVRIVWHRTGAGIDAFAPKRTHSEALDFIDRHGKILKAVKHIFEEDKDGHISKILSPGTAAGLLYLMASCKSDVDKYRNADTRSEKKMDFEQWEKACEFWVLLSANAAEMEEVRKGLNNLVDPETGEAAPLAHKMALLIKAWNVFAQGYEITAKDLKLKKETDEEGVKHLVECPTCGGIDLGNPKEEEEATAGEETPEAESDTPAAPEEPDKTPAVDPERAAKVAAVAKRLKAAREAKARKLAEQNGQTVPEEVTA